MRYHGEESQLAHQRPSSPTTLQTSRLQHVGPARTRTSPLTPQTKLKIHEQPWMAVCSKHLALRFLPKQQVTDVPSGAEDACPAPCTNPWREKQASWARGPAREDKVQLVWESSLWTIWGTDILLTCVFYVSAAKGPALTISETHLGGGLWRKLKSTFSGLVQRFICEAQGSALSCVAPWEHWGASLFSKLGTFRTRGKHDLWGSQACSQKFSVKWGLERTWGQLLRTKVVFVMILFFNITSLMC